MKSRKKKRPNGWREVPDALWEMIQPLLPPEKEFGTPGRRVIPFRTVTNGILYVLRTGCQWKRVPMCYRSGSTCHNRFQEWVKAGVFETMWERCLLFYDDLKGVDWRWQNLDSQTVSAPVKGGIGNVWGQTPPTEGKTAPSATT